MKYRSFDPYWQTDLNSWPLDSDTQLSRKIEETHIAWKEWRETTVQQRADFLLRLALVILEEKEYHASLIISEMGKTYSQAVAEVEKCATLCDYYATHATRFLQCSERESGATESYVRLDPQGIVLGIMPWNYPYWQVFRFMVPALAGGNGVLLKHASNVTGCALAIESAVSKAALPQSIVRVILPSHQQMERIIAMPQIRGIALTGSNFAGSVVAALAGKHIKKCVLELGGSDPFIVFHDADADNAAQAAVMGRFQNCGQSCIAAKRLIIHESVYDRFVDVFLRHVSEIRAGDPSDKDVFLGPLVNSAAASEIDKQVKTTISMGGSLLAGGKPGSEGPAFYEPTVLTDIPPDSPVLVEEVFGPVAPLIRFSTPDEAIETANSSRFGLGASVWTADKEFAMSIAARLDTGSVAVNGFMRSDPFLPFGGVKDSGYGRELSFEGFCEFLNTKSVAFY